MSEQMCEKCYQLTPLSECVLSRDPDSMKLTTVCRWCKWPRGEKPEVTVTVTTTAEAGEKTD